MFLTLNHQNKILLVTSKQAMRQEVQVQETLSNQAELTETLITQGGGILAFIFFMGGFLFLASKKLKDVSDDQLDLCKNSLPNHRCTQCRYFAKNHFINCAVQPSIVLTDEATNCSDYCPKNQKP
ncbi:hypothetical protein DSM106972_096120 [Dulcicalothrix desertica PCC 7102]|uniref:Uncharacterized protein n=1 Tax=Dulcicalothrix desertica PCC 7102 TaxID=232991 RepID=A0A3S1BYH2_9CYAN|nr:hypothetical protein [Dulcicalothrix desertica]RUS93463.1 hypothetical protein DSM106972_096120 [Dulcicalothrix desertica PCC 7102]TWH39690.1 hypothetical protein CAL7102_08943 [Dulcicalothrix desertica PCC 7102]